MNFDTRAVCKTCYSWYTLPFNSFAHLHKDVCWKCGADKYSFEQFTGRLTTAVVKQGAGIWWKPWTWWYHSETVWQIKVGGETREFESLREFLEHEL